MKWLNVILKSSKKLENKANKVICNYIVLLDLLHLHELLFLFSPLEDKESLHRQKQHGNKR